MIRAIGRAASRGLSVSAAALLVGLWQAAHWLTCRPGRERRQRLASRRRPRARAAEAHHVWGRELGRQLRAVATCVARFGRKGRAGERDRGGRAHEGELSRESSHLRVLKPVIPPKIHSYYAILCANGQGSITIGAIIATGGWPSTVRVASAAQAAGERVCVGAERRCESHRLCTRIGS